MAKSDADFVQEIIDAHKGGNSAELAKKIVKKLGHRIRQRARDREDVNQAAARTIREATGE